MYIDAHSILRQQVLRAALDQYALVQMRRMTEILDSPQPDDNAAAAFHSRYVEAKDVLAEMDMHQRRRAMHPAMDPRTLSQRSLTTERGET